MFEVPVRKLLQETRSYQIGQPGKREVKWTNDLFIDNLKVYQESYKVLENVNESIVQTSRDTGACCGVAKCLIIIFERGKMIKGERLQVLPERIKNMDPDLDREKKKEIYKFL